jgi:hypothetical protein
MVTKKYKIFPGMPNLVEDVPTGAATEFLGAGYINGSLYIFAHVDPEDATETHEFVAVGDDAHLDPGRCHKFVGLAISGETSHLVYRRLPERGEP